MDFQVLDADYVMVNDKPIMRLFCKGENGESVCAFHEGFAPYFYVTGEGVESKLEGNPHVVSVKKTKRNLPIGYQPSREVYKITLRNPAKTVEVRDMLRSMGYVTYEADIPFKYRWMNDNNVGGMKWINVSNGNGLTTDSVCSERCIQLNDIKPVDKIGDAPLKYLALDIETVSDEEGRMPVAEKDPTVMISLVFEPSYRERKSMVLSIRPGSNVEGCGDEKGMLEKFIEIVMDYDPDVITGFNINNFDMPYILERMKRNRVKPIFGRCKSKYVRADKFANMHRIGITGRVIADSFTVIKKGWNLKRYGLDFVSKELLGEEKDDVKKSEIGKFWRGTQEQFETLASYCLQDSVLAMNLLLKLNLMGKYIALSKISGSLLQDMLEGGETQRIENYLLREFNREGYIIPSKLDKDKVSNGGQSTDTGEDLKGGFVLEPKKGLHSMVLVLDFKSMYPSLIRTYNICPTTLVVNNDESDTIDTPSGSKFVSKKVRHGIMPKILERMMKERGKVKMDMKNATGPVKLELDMRQTALKVMSNAFYGYFGYQRAKIYCMDIARSITSLGRHTIQRTVKTVEDEYKYEVVYGDTDSVMIKVKTDDMDEAEKIGKDLSNNITKMLPGIMELEFEKILKRFLPLTKKRYMAWSKERGRDGKWADGMVMKGIETVRRDWCGLTSETMRQIIEIILKKEDVKAAVKYFRGVVENLLQGNVDIEKLVITKTITKKPEAYAGVQPHVEVVKKMQQRNVLEIPGIGDRIGYVIVKGTQLLSKRAEDPTFVQERGLHIDPTYYIDNQLLPPLERIFNALGVDKEELLGMGKQMGIMDAINNHKNKTQEQKPITVNIKEVDGFICKKCNRPYMSPPLIGKCECGGVFLFSSVKGPAEKATIV